MKKILSILVALILTSVMAFSALTASAANGIDIVDTFESYYGKKDLISSTWKTDGCFKGNISTDTQNSAPQRGNGKDKGNYRSMKATFNFTSDTWGSVRDMTEDSYALIDPVANNKDVYFTFYAKADKAMTFTAEVDIKDCPFYGKVKLTTSWQKYSLKLRDLTPELKDKNGNMTKIYDRNAQQAWGNGKEEAFLVGFKFQLSKEDNTSLSSGTLWVDTIAFEGTTITERSADNTQDKSGTVPADFKADTSTGSSSSGSTSSSSSSKPTSTGSSSTSSTNSSKTGSTQNSNTTSSSTDSKTTSTNSDGSTVESTDNSSTITGDAEDESSKNDETDNDSSDDSSDDTSNDSSKKSDKAGMSTGTKVAISIVVILVLAGAAVAVYFLVYKKKKEQK